MGLNFKNCIELCCVVLISFGLQPPAAASPWGKEKGEIFIASETRNFQSPEFLQSSTGLYVEFGATDKWMAGGKVEYANQQYGGAFPSIASGLSTVEFFAQREISRTDRNVAALKVTYAAPTKLQRQLVLPDIRYSDLTYGNAVEGALSFGHSFNETGSIFASAELGYRYSLGDDADQFRADFLAGMKPTKNWMLLLKSSHTLSLQNGAINGIDYDVHRIEPSVIFSRPDKPSYGLSYSHDISGRHLSTGSAITFSIWNEF